jgi:hypothetical protein
MTHPDKITRRDALSITWHDKPVLERKLFIRVGGDEERSRPVEEDSGLGHLDVADVEVHGDEDALDVGRQVGSDFDYRSIHFKVVSGRIGLRSPGEKKITV